jgi:phospholipid/cholesterol/gamma-HCH transport system permease protein
MPSEWIARHDQTLALQGEWTLANYRRIKSALAQSEVGKAPDERVSLAAVSRLDTAGAILIVELIGVEKAQAVTEWACELSKDQRALLIRIAKAMDAPLDAKPLSYSRISQAFASAKGLQSPTGPPNLPAGSSGSINSLPERRRNWSRTGIVSLRFVFL